MPPAHYIPPEYNADCARIKIATPFFQLGETEQDFQLRRIEASRHGDSQKVLPIARLAYAHAASINMPEWDAPKKLVKLDGSWAKCSRLVTEPHRESELVEVLN